MAVVCPFIDKTAQHLAGFKPMTSWSQGVLWTSVRQPPNKSQLSKITIFLLFSSNLPKSPIIIYLKLKSHNLIVSGFSLLEGSPLQKSVKRPFSRVDDNFFVAFLVRCLAWISPVRAGLLLSTLQNLFYDLGHLSLKMQSVEFDITVPPGQNECQNLMLKI